MTRPKTTKTAIRSAPGIRKIVRDYGTYKVTKYEGRINDVDGGRGLVSVGTFDGFDAAKRALNKAKRDLDGNTFVPPSAGKALFGTVAQDWLASHEVVSLKARTRDGYRALIAGRLAPLHHVPVGQLRSKKRLSLFLADLTADGLSPATVRNVLAVLRAVPDEAVQQELLPANPAPSLKPPKPRRVQRQGLEISEVEDLIRALPERWSLLVETAAYTGLRAGELAGLKVEQLDLKRRQVRVTRTVVDVKGELLEDTPKTEAVFSFSLKTVRTDRSWAIATAVSTNSSGDPGSASS
jgi:integrase